MVCPNEGVTILAPWTEDCIFCLTNPADASMSMQDRYRFIFKRQGVRADVHVVDGAELDAMTDVPMLFNEAYPDFPYGLLARDRSPNTWSKMPQEMLTAYRAHLLNAAGVDSPCQNAGSGAQQPACEKVVLVRRATGYLDTGVALARLSAGQRAEGTACVGSCSRSLAQTFYDGAKQFLAERGIDYTIAELENMEMADQIRLFASAKLVIAQHGAALSNIVVSSPGTHVVEIGPVKYPCYLHLAEGLQQVHTQADCEDFCDEIMAVVTELYPASAESVPTPTQQVGEGAPSPALPAGEEADALLQRIEATAGSRSFSIVMFGDSTVERQWLILSPWLYSLGTAEQGAQTPTKLRLHLSGLPQWNHSHMAEFGAEKALGWTQRTVVGETEVVLTVVYSQKELLDMALCPDIAQLLLPAHDIPAPDLVLLGTAGVHHLARFFARGIKDVGWPLKHFEKRLGEALTGMQEAYPNADLRFFVSHWVCDEKIDVAQDNGAGRTRALACAAGEATGCFGRGDEVEVHWEPPADHFRQWFNASIFSAWGSENLARREKDVLATPEFFSRWRLVDGQALTYGRCDETDDGDHYSERIVREELKQMLQFPDGEVKLRAAQEDAHR